MLIVSSFRDFYDSIKSYGVDKTVVYNRKEECYKIEKLGWKPKNDLYSIPYAEEFTIKKLQIEFHKYVIGFCGNIFPVIRAVIKETTTWKTISTYHFYDLTVLRNFTNLYKLTKSKHKLVFWNKKDYRVMSDEHMKEFFNSNNWNFLKQDFIKHKTPVFVLGKFRLEGDILWHGHNCIIKNTCLKNYEFYKVKNSVSAFQEIYMFLSGVLGTPERPMVKIDDKKLQAKRGHDGKYSFKTPPKEKK
jgi:hypothetical protein